MWSSPARAQCTGHRLYSSQSVSLPSLSNLIKSGTDFFQGGKCTVSWARGERLVTSSLRIKIVETIVYQQDLENKKATAWAVPYYFTNPTIPLHHSSEIKRSRPTGTPPHFTLSAVALLSLTKLFLFYGSIAQFKILVFVKLYQSWYFFMCVVSGQRYFYLIYLFFV